MPMKCLPPYTHFYVAKLEFRGRFKGLHNFTTEAALISTCTQNPCFEQNFGGKNRCFELKITQKKIIFHFVVFSYDFRVASLEGRCPMSSVNVSLSGLYVQ